MYNDYKNQIEEIMNSNLSDVTKGHIFCRYISDINNDDYDLMFNEEEKKKLLSLLNKYVKQVWQEIKLIPITLKAQQGLAKGVKE